MKSELILQNKITCARTLEDCFQQTGIYQHIGNGDYLIVIRVGMHPIFFGMYAVGGVFPHVDSDNGLKNYTRLGDVGLQVKLMENG